jgi:hypothetical protein
MQKELFLDRYRAALAYQSPLVAPLVLATLLVGVAIPLYNKGVILAVEALFLLISPVIIPTISSSRFLKMLWALSALWSASQIVSDIVHSTQMFSAPTFVGPSVALLASGLFWVHDNFRISVSAILIAVGLGWVCLELIAGQAMASSNPWKYGMSTPVVVTILAFAHARKFKRRSILVLLIVLAGISLRFDSRLETGLLLACAAGLFVVGKQNGVGSRGWWRLGLLAAAALGMYFAYPSIALSGLLGDRAYAQQVLYESQGSNFLLATRLEFPQMIYLVAQHPWLGIGSYAGLSTGEAFAALGFLNDYVAPLSQNAQQYLLNPSEGYPGYNTHSAAMGSVLFAGILALPFWIFLLWSILRSAWSFTKGRVIVPALLIYMCGLTSWDTFFSPLTTRSHVSLAVTVFLVGVNSAWRKKDSEILDSKPVMLGPAADVKGGI